MTMRKLGAPHLLRSQTLFASSPSHVNSYLRLGANLYIIVQFSLGGMGCVVNLLASMGNAGEEGEGAGHTMISCCGRG